MTDSRDDKLARLAELRRQALAGGGPDKIARIHEKGRLTAKEPCPKVTEPRPLHSGQGETFAPGAAPLP